VGVVGEQDETVRVSMTGAAGEMVGTTLAARYRIDAKLGEGGMAAVYLATDERVDRQVVVKVPHARLVETPGFLARFQRELRSLIQAEHPSVVQLYDLGEHEGLPFAVAQYLRGGNLGDRIRRAGQQRPEEVLRWLPAAARALDSIHASGFVHRDVKPDNILFDQHDHVFVSDFGIAKALPDPERDQQTELTQAGYFVGSPAYAPPEALDDQLSPAYDQYSLAVSVYEALCGEKPFQATSLQALLRDKATRDPAPLPRHAKLPPAARRALMRALARDPQQRFPSCTAFAEAFAAGLGRGAPRWPWAAAAGALLAVGAWALWSARQPPPPNPQEPTGTSAETAVTEPQRVEPEQLPAEPEPPTGPEPAEQPAEETAAAPAQAALPTTFRAGSSEAEVRDALALCARYESECDPEWYDSETLREVEVAPVALDRHEVTNAQFAAFAASHDYVTTAEQQGFSYDGSFRVGELSWRMPAGPGSSSDDHPDHPVVHVSAADAEAYCASQGKRLPSEDEWELAARGRERRIFPWGDTWEDSRAVWHASRDSGLAAVGSRPAGNTPEGREDLAGNVWEWTSTRDEDGRILKGGSWRETNPANLRAAVRMVEDPRGTNSDIGFRCAAEDAGSG
jgi:formylglycine-generating enzyme required for sulfatase activity/tRNA A-37 threonylcarbamoyl transferase component Bud32